jgi:8-oxo-dGTP diphosphatase
MLNLGTLKVACAVIIKDQKIIITQRSENMLLPLKWEFPGGKIEKDESEEECLHREIMEELNIRININHKLDKIIYKYDNLLICLIPYVVDYMSGDIILKEHKQFKLVSRNELLHFDFAEADIPITLSLINLK